MVLCDMYIMLQIGRMVAIIRLNGGIRHILLLRLCQRLVMTTVR